MIIKILFGLLFVVLLIGLIVPKRYTTLTVKKEKKKNYPTWLESASYIIGKYEQDE
jgi:hypothetical protein